MSTGRTRLRARVPRTLLAAAALLAATSRAGAQEVLLTTEQAVKEIFPEAARTAAERHALTAAVRRGRRPERVRRLRRASRLRGRDGGNRKVPAHHVHGRRDPRSARARRGGHG